ncbi:AtpZ/AtpI family protein [Janthinobacterium sp.]|uniref:AtpZ/AtpI family protein n=1 Tax=Janthinobacterium sp. TaxID=1871054 RepID=UPI00293D756F|nr:AtpZ/AtpI family protein [Janthinobacterium sp.]
MAELPPRKDREPPALADAVGARAARKLKARRRPPLVWSGLGVMGLIGWSVVLPTLGGAALGMWLDQHQVGRHAWTLALLMAGLALGCINAWLWVAREAKALSDEQEEDNE